MKRFLLDIFTFLVPCMVVVAYYCIHVQPNINGDLGRLGFLPFDRDYTAARTVDAYPQGHIVIHSPREIEDTTSILFVGDSFTRFQAFHGMANFVNRYAMQDSLSKVYNLQVDNIANNLAQVVVDILRFSDTMPGRIVLEITERSMEYYYSGVDFDTDHPLSPVFTGVCCKGTGNATPKSGGRWYDEARQTLLDTQQYFKKRLGIQCAVICESLQQEFFTCCGDESNLYFYQDDIKGRYSEESVRTVRDNMRRLNELAASRNVRLLILAPSDKYAIYKPYIVRDRHKAASFLDHFEDFDEDFFINTRTLFRPCLKKGTKDLYLCNDSHWGALAAGIVANEIHRRLENGKTTASD